MMCRKPSDSNGIFRCPELLVLVRSVFTAGRLSPGRPKTAPCAARTGPRDSNL
jgi:hypothetical protein